MATKRHDNAASGPHPDKTTTPLPAEPVDTTGTGCQPASSGFQQEFQMRPRLQNNLSLVNPGLNFLSAIIRYGFYIHYSKV